MLQNITTYDDIISQAKEEKRLFYIQNNFDFYTTVKSKDPFFRIFLLCKDRESIESKKFIIDILDFLKYVIFEYEAMYKIYVCDSNDSFLVEDVECFSLEANGKECLSSNYFKDNQIIIVNYPNTSYRRCFLHFNYTEHKKRAVLNLGFKISTTIGFSKRDVLNTSLRVIRTDHIINYLTFVQFYTHKLNEDFHKIVSYYRNAVDNILLKEEDLKNNKFDDFIFDYYHIDTLILLYSSFNNRVNQLNSSLILLYCGVSKSDDLEDSFKSQFLHYIDKYRVILQKGSRNLSIVSVNFDIDRLLNDYLKALLSKDIVLSSYLNKKIKDIMVNFDSISKEYYFVCDIKEAFANLESFLKDVIIEKKMQSVKSINKGSCSIYSSHSD